MTTVAGLCASGGASSASFRESVRRAASAMRTIAIIGLVPAFCCPRFGQAPDRTQPPGDASGLPGASMRHHQPSQAEIDDREREMLRARPTDRLASYNVEPRFLAACRERLRLDEPLGSEGSHSAFCACRLEALRRSAIPDGVALVAENLEKRNQAVPYTERLPAALDRSNQAAISACWGELSR